MVFDLFYVSIAVLVLVIVGMIVRAVRLTKASIAETSRHIDLTNPDVVASVAEQLRAQPAACPRCGGGAFALLGTTNRYTCDSCNLEFEGAQHVIRPPR